MTPARFFLLFLALVWGLAGWQVVARQGQAFDSAEQADAALRAAVLEQNRARQRGERLEAEAKTATLAADRSAREAAALAARIQEAEAQIVATGARIALVERQQRALRERIGAKQEPLVRLTGAMQIMARRPVVLAMMQPGSLEDTVHTRAVLEAIMPEVARRTSGLRAELAHGRQLRQRAMNERSALRNAQGMLGERQQQLVAIEARQRLESRAVMGSANREVDRVLALAEDTRDLTTLVGQLERDAVLREKLAALPGPVLRPRNPGDVLMVEQVSQGQGTAPVQIDYILPVAGRLVSAFGERQAGGPASGTAFATRGGALAVAPAGGRVAFAGPYRGYGRIVIIEHPGGWTTLVTGLGRIDVAVGQQVVQGMALGITPAGQPVLSVELRKDGAPVNVLSVVRG